MNDGLFLNAKSSEMPWRAIGIEVLGITFFGGNGF